MNGDNKMTLTNQLRATRAARSKTKLAIMNGIVVDGSGNFANAANAAMFAEYLRASGAAVPRAPRALLAAFHMLRAKTDGVADDARAASAAWVRINVDGEKPAVDAARAFGYDRQRAAIPPSTVNNGENENGS